MALIQLGLITQVINYWSQVDEAHRVYVCYMTCFGLKTSQSCGILRVIENILLLPERLIICLY